MNVLVLNAGSGTLKAARFTNPAGAIGHPADPDWTATEPAAGGRHTEAARKILAAVGADIDVVGHRIVHGGPEVVQPAALTSDVRAALDAAADLAPIHGPAALAVLDAAQAAFPAALHVAVPDTGFHRTLPPAAAAYGGPRRWFDSGLRRYGFHGIAHEYAAHRASTRLGRPVKDLRVLSCHLGGGCSVAAIDRGRSVDTTMGFTPLDGLPMATRSGAVDPGLLIHLLRTGMTVDELDHTVQLDSGLLGLSGHSADLVEVLARADGGDDGARLAADVYLHRLRSGAAAMLAALGGLDAVVISGGVGEHVPAVHDTLRRFLDTFGLDAAVLVEEAREDWVIALTVARVASAAPASR